MTRLLNKIKSRLHIVSFRKAVGVLEGEYIALTRGRSLDFEDLRDYVAGEDSIRDIDWRSTARSAKPLVKKFISNKQQPVTFIVDTGRGMEALSLTGHRKKDLAIEVVGTLGYLTVKHHDPVSLIYGNEEIQEFIPAREGESRLEHILQTIYSETNTAAPAGDIYSLCEFASKAVKTRGISIIISSDFILTEELEEALNRLAHTQEIIWIAVKDGDPLLEPDANTIIQDIETEEYIPEFIRSNNKLHNWFHIQEDQRTLQYEDFMSENRISFTEIDSPEALIPTLIKLLEARKYEQRRR